jgi:ABC-type glycerol-3-phosphate transport system permease component
MAAAVYMTLPVIGLFCVAQRYFLHDLTLTNRSDDR